MHGGVRLEAIEHAERTRLDRLSRLNMPKGPNRLNLTKHTQQTKLTKPNRPNSATGQLSFHPKNVDLRAHLRLFLAPKVLEWFGYCWEAFQWKVSSRKHPMESVRWKVPNGNSPIEKAMESLSNNPTLNT